MVVPKAWINSITFSDQTTVNLDQDDVVVIVGPNNSGKSEVLRAIRDKLLDSATRSPVVSELTLCKTGTVEDVIEWVGKRARIDLVRAPGNPHYELFGTTIARSLIVSVWPATAPQLGQLARFFCNLLTADERLHAAHPAPGIALLHTAPTNPIHFLQRDDSLELRLSSQFKKAFGVDLIVHRNAGNQVPLYTGERPKPKSGQDRISYEYVVELEKLTRLQTQGDGMRSFAGVLLHNFVGQESMLLIDEPEAFLHPPQARLLGRMLVLDKAAGTQLLLATHSGDILRGVLDSNSNRVRVVRIQRQGDVNPIRQLDNSKVAELWSDPLLRYSNILDGLFHEAVVVTESDSDARFYAAVADALFDETSSDARKPDIMFTHGGSGKTRLPVIVRSLRELGVPVKAVADFDILNDEHPLAELVTAAGGEWSKLKPEWTTVKNSIDSKKPELRSTEVRQEISKILSQVIEDYFPARAKGDIKEILRRSSPWAHAKTVGKAFVPSGEPTVICDRLLEKLRALGIFVVEVGEVEGFVRTVGDHGPGWVNEVLKRDLKTDPELDVARKFVGVLLGRDGDG